MLKVYGTMQCPDCVRCKESFEKCGIEYEYIDVLSGLREIKSFLRLRDHYQEFEESKRYGMMGIPALLEEDGRLTLDWVGYLMERGFMPSGEPVKNSCGIDGKGC